MKSDADIIRDAKLEAMGLPPQEDHHPRRDRPQMATDEMVRLLALRPEVRTHMGTGYGTLQEAYAKIVSIIYPPSVFLLLYHWTLPGHLFLRLTASNFQFHGVPATHTPHCL